METDSWELNSESTMQLNASLDCFYELRYVCMARVESGTCVDDADDRSRQCIFAIPGSFDEDLAEE